jgi:hypothetical protein
MSAPAASPQPDVSQGTQGANPSLLRALELARQGGKVFPCHGVDEQGKCSCRKPDCDREGKHPQWEKGTLEHGKDDATCDERQIFAWAAKWPQANWAFVPLSLNWAVIDMDGEQGQQAFKVLPGYQKLPKTYTVKTGREGGYHAYLALPAGVAVKEGDLVEQVLTAKSKGYVMLAGCGHKSGRRYTANDPDAPVASCPDWLLAHLAAAQRPNVPAAIDATIAKGKGEPMKFALAVRMFKAGATEQEVLDAELARDKRCEHQEGEAVIRRRVADWHKRFAGGGDAPSGFSLIPLADLLAKGDTPVEYIWKGHLVAGTVSAVVAKPKVGKSTLARNLFLAIARGEDFLGLPTLQGECIYLALEERENEVRADFAALGADGTEPILVHAATAPAEGMFVLCELVRERKPRLVVIDPLFRLARVKDESAYAETYAALGPLIDVARETGTHLMLLHHSGKGMKADAIDSPLGSTAIGGAVCTLVVLKRTESYRTIQTVQRVPSDLPETVVEFDAEIRRLSLGAEKAQADIQTIQLDIMAYLQTEDAKTELEIDEHVEGKTGVKRKALRALVEQGRVTREGIGRKGDPFLYKCSFPRSPHIAGTRERESEKPHQPLVNTGVILVPDNSEPPILVPEREKGELLPPRRSFRRSKLPEAS